MGLVSLGTRVLTSPSLCTLPLEFGLNPSAFANCISGRTLEPDKADATAASAKSARLHHPGRAMTTATTGPGNPAGRPCGSRYKLSETVICAPYWPRWRG